MLAKILIVGNLLQKSASIPCCFEWQGKLLDSSQKCRGTMSSQQQKYYQNTLAGLCRWNACKHHLRSPFGARTRLQENSICGMKSNNLSTIQTNKDWNTWLRVGYLMQCNTFSSISSTVDWKETLFYNGGTVMVPSLQAKHGNLFSFPSLCFSSSSPCMLGHTWLGVDMLFLTTRLHHQGAPYEKKQKKKNSIDMTASMCKNTKLWTTWRFPHS